MRSLLTASLLTLVAAGSPLAQAAAQCFPENPELPVILGTAGDDLLLGGDQSERICALAGADQVLAGGGDDRVRGDDGNDRLQGEAGPDRLWAGKGNDLLRGGDGDDRLFGQMGDDRLWGEEGADLLEGGPGDDVYFYRLGDGDDLIRDRAGANRLVLLRIEPSQVSTEVVGEDLLVRVDAGDRSGTLLIEDHTLPCGGCSLSLEADDRPNLVVIFADDLGWGDLGAYGQQRILTPELDAMAAEGVRFTQFYSAAPHCQPARNSLFTGLHTGHTHVRLEEPMSADGPLLSQLLQDAGYATALFGKWGMSRMGPGDRPVEADPATLGFDRFAGQLTHRDAQVHYLDGPPEPPGTPQHPYYPDVRQYLFTIRDGRTEPLFLPPDRYVHDELVERALAFVEAHRGRPFFLYLPFTLPHAELVVPAGSLAPYLDGNGNSLFPEIPWTPPLDGRGFDRHNPAPRATYAGMVSRLSRDVGRLLDRVRELGLGEDTVVLFTSDNGPHDAGGIVSPAFFASAGPFSGIKWSLREGGIRVPAVAWWPGRFPPGVQPTPAALWDLFPTLLDLAGVPPPGPVDGLSLRPILEGKAALLDRPLYWETFNPRADYRQAVRLGRYKALRRVGSDRVELYDLAADPTESQDLADRPSLCPLLLRLKALLNDSREPPPNNPGGRYDIPPLPLTCGAP